MRTLCPDKLFLEAPTSGVGANCTSCSHCPWMAMNGLQNLAQVLETGNNEIVVDPAIIPRAVLPIKRMLDFAKAINLPTRGLGNA
jgi:quinolinate synthase